MRLFKQRSVGHFQPSPPLVGAVLSVRDRAVLLGTYCTAELESAWLPVATTENFLEKLLDDHLSGGVDQALSTLAMVPPTWTSPS